MRFTHPDLLFLHMNVYFTKSIGISNCNLFLLNLSLVYVSRIDLQYFLNRYYNYKLSINGEPEDHKDNYEVCFWSKQIVRS